MGITLDASHDRFFVGVSLLAIAVYQRRIRCLTLRYREQAHSYRGNCLLLALEDLIHDPIGLEGLFGDCRMI